MGWARPFSALLKVSPRWWVMWALEQLSWPLCFLPRSYFVNPNRLAKKAVCLLALSFLKVMSFLRRMLCISGRTSCLSLFDTLKSCFKLFSSCLSWWILFSVLFLVCFVVVGSSQKMQSANPNCPGCHAYNLKCLINRAHLAGAECITSVPKKQVQKQTLTMYLHFLFLILEKCVHFLNVSVKHTLIWLSLMLL